MDSNVGALKNEIAQIRRLVADLRGELGEVLTHQNNLERSFEEQLDRHREDLDWDREECCQEYYQNSVLFSQFLLSYAALTISFLTFSFP